jgi:hypothetical protein
MAAACCNVQSRHCDPQPEEDRGDVDEDNRDWSQGPDGRPPLHDEPRTPTGSDGSVHQKFGLD